MDKKEEPNFYIDDVVCLRSKKHQTGTITRVSWIDDDDDSSDEDEVPLEENKVEVLWNDFRTTEIHYNKLNLIDRSLLHGDIVASLSDPQGQTGYVVDVILSVDLKMIKSPSQKIPNVFCRYLTDVHPFISGRHVTLKHPPKLVGTVEEVIYNVEVRFPNDSVCLVRNISQDYLTPEVEGEEDSTSCTYYPSQKVSAPARVWTNAEWLSKGNPRGKTKKKKYTSGIVTKVTPVSVVVSWIIQSEVPVDEICNPDDLIVLNTFRNTKYEVGDHILIHPTVKSHFIARNKEYGGKFPIPSSDKVSIHEQLMALIHTWEGTETDSAMVTCTHTYVRIQWQDGTFSGWIHSTDLIPRDHLLDCDFWPGDFVLNKENQTPGSIEKSGIVSRVNFQDKTAVVKWILEEGVGDEEEVSLYDIGEHPDFQFRLGGVVLSLVNNDVGEVIDLCGDSIRVSWSGNYVSTEKSITLKAVDTSDEMSYDDDTDDEEKDDGDGDGDDGDNDDDDGDDDNGDDDDGDDDNGDDGIDDDEDGDDDDRQKSDIKNCDSDSVVENKTRCPSLLSFATSSLVFLLTLGKTGNTNNNKNKRKQPPSKVRNEKSKKNSEKEKSDFTEIESDSKMETEKNEERKEEEEKKEEIQKSSDHPKNSDQQQQQPQQPGVTQDVLSTQDYPSFLVLDQENGGHHYSVLSHNSQFNNKIARIINKEWKTLQNVLPTNIYVVTYSNRMDLLKVLIIGPVNTVYYNSYFIFDICLPADYPLSPPKVFYNSGGYRLHPNLYEDGTVCLSLLGTWSGSQQEQWVPHQSSLLQLFVSIQGLILGVKEPYFLEAGYDKQRGTKQGMQSSGIYNEKALLLSLKRMLQNFQNPPSEFREVIKKHFSYHYRDVLTLVLYCESLLNNTGEGGIDFEGIGDKYYLPETPSRGFLQPVVKDFKIKFDLEINDMLKRKGE